MSRKLTLSKMHGAGNDYLFINALKEPCALNRDRIVRLCDRHFGVGADGVVLIVPSRTYDFGMRIFNADGSEAEMCGNAIRCVGKYLFDRGFTDNRRITIETAAGPRRLELKVHGGAATAAEVDMGEPSWTPGEVPLLPAELSALKRMIEAAAPGATLVCLSIGNPHAVCFVKQLSDDLVRNLGPHVENHGAFPRRANVEFVRVINRSALEMRVWERGSGETLACGTGACAAAAAAASIKACGRKVTVRLRGGVLEIEWKDDNRLYMTGPAEFVFDATLDLDLENESHAGA